MSQIGGKRMVLTAAILIAGFVAFILNARLGLTNAGQAENAVRMAVDPTVLPPITANTTQPPAPVPSKDDSSSPPVAETQVIELDPTPEQAEKSQGQDNLEPVSKPAEKPRDNTLSGNGVIADIDLDVSDSQFAVTVSCDRPVGDTTYMNLNNPKRLVIDLRQQWTLRTRNVVRAESGPVKYIVVGHHPDRTRLVVHFRSDSTERLSPQFERTGNRLIVTSPLP